MTEYGNVNLIEQREQLEGGNVALQLPGVKKGDMAARAFRPEVRVSCLQFSPTGMIVMILFTLRENIINFNFGLRV